MSSCQLLIRPCVQLLVDDFAKNGFRTVAIDYFDGDPISQDVISQPVSVVYG
jgi:hypothetical protein